MVSFELNGQDIYIILAQTLSQVERATIYGATTQWGDGYHDKPPAISHGGNGHSPNGAQLGL